MILDHSESTLRFFESFQVENLASINKKIKLDRTPPTPDKHLDIVYPFKKRVHDEGAYQ